MAAATAMGQRPCMIHLITDSEYVMNGLRALASGSELQQDARNLDKWWRIEKHIHKLKEVTLKILPACINYSFQLPTLVLLSLFDLA